MKVQARMEVETTVASRKRRLCLRATAAIAAAASLGREAVAAESSVRMPRVISLSWDLTEMLLSLGVTPVGVAAPDWYRSSVVMPPLPGSVVDVGLLFQPNYDLLYELRPDLMLITPAHAGARPSFERIAPTLTLGAYMSDPSPYRKMRAEVAVLAARLGVERNVTRLLDGTSDVLDQARAKLEAGRPASGYDAIFIAQALDDRRVRLFGTGSMFDEILRMLGLRNAATADRNASGVEHGALIAGRAGYGIVGLERLVSVPSARLLWIGAPKTGIERNPLWPQLPFSRPGRSATLPVISPTGALISVRRFALAIADAMQNHHVI